MIGISSSCFKPISESLIRSPRLQNNFYPSWRYCCKYPYPLRRLVATSHQHCIGAKHYWRRMRPVLFLQAGPM